MEAGNRGVIILALVGFVLCLANLATASDELPPIKIGANLALTGKLAFFGEIQRNGFQLAVDQINAKGGVGGRKLALLVEDNRGESKEAVTAARLLLDLHKVDIVLSAFTHISQAIAPIVSRKNSILIYASTFPDIAAQDRRIFKDHFDGRESGKLIAEALVTAGFKKVAYLSEQNDACDAYELGFRRKAEELGIIISERQLYNPGETDFNTVLLRLKIKSPEAIVLCTWRDTHLVMSKISELGMIGTPTYHA